MHVVDSIDQLTMIAAQYATGMHPVATVPARRAAVDDGPDPAARGQGDGVGLHPRSRTSPADDAGGDLSGSWDEAETEEFVKRMEDEIERLAPGFRSLVRGRFVRNPVDFQRDNANLVGGALGGGTAQLHQQLVFRPVPGLGRPETPIKGLYLGSASAHPGGGVHGAPGANAARAAIVHQRVRRILPFGR